MVPKREPLKYDTIIIQDLGCALRKRYEPKGSWIAWKKPDSGQLALSVSGVFTAGKGGIGGVLRDEEGKFIWSFAAPSPFDNTVATELHGIYMGLRRCIDKGIRNVWIESDAREIINMVNGESQWQFTYQVRGIQALLRDVQGIRFIYRERCFSGGWFG